MKRVVGVAVLSALAACGGGGDAPVKLGLQRIGLELAFQGEATEAALPSLPPLPAAQPEFEIVDGELRMLAPSIDTSVVRCPAAPEGAVPAEPVVLQVDAPPAAGTYAVRNRGTLAVVLGTLRFSSAYPVTTTKEIGAITDESGVADALGTPGIRTIEFDVTETLGALSGTDRLRVTPTRIELLRREVRTQDATVVFEPVSPVTLVELDAGEGDAWTSASADVDSGATMLVEGAIERREAVDVCGQVVDTYRVRSSERIVALATDVPYSITTDDVDDPEGSPNVYNVATTLGGLFISVETHTSSIIGGATIEIDNVAIYMSVTPS